MTTEADPYSQLIRQAYRAFRQGDRHAARRAAQEALAQDPGQEEAWLLLAAIAGPRASLGYLRQALQINPASQRAQAGLRWALQRQVPAGVPTQPLPTPPRSIVPASIPEEALVKTRPVLWPLVAVLALVALSLAAWIAPYYISSAQTSMAYKPLALAQFAKETRTPTPTLTPTATSTASPSPTPLPPTSTSTALPTDTPTLPPTVTPTLLPTETFTPAPSETPTEKPRRAKKKKKQQASEGEPYQNPGRPERVSGDERWIDVDLSTQTTHAYEGDNLVRSFLVSTGTWLHPTVTGTYRIYVKYQAADMYGADYYLPSVPYVMYFYEGYGIHGTYWHNNFGTPMSHGCVNLTPDDAGWLFDFAEVGTVVNIHQ
jgi:lipoprotein-anchoring transpeptidase ErfK/SrfK